MSTELQVVQETPPLSISEMKQHLNLIQDAMREVMKEGEDFGTIQGTPKPTLLKPGAEKLNLLFRLDPEYDIQETYEATQEGPKHYTVVSKCTLYHSPTGRRLGSGYGSCSTKEKKYAYRDQKRKCPKCGKETIFKSKKEGDGWYCWAKQNGCGATFKAGDETIESQTVGQILNPDLADQYNTILKMANKRSLVAASLNVTGASAIFTQDVEDMVPYQDKAPKEAQKEEVQQTRHKDEAVTVAEPITDGNRLEMIKAALWDCENLKDLNQVMKSLTDAERNLVGDTYLKRSKEIAGF